MSSAPREENHVPALVAKSDADNTPVIVEADPVTKRLKTNTTVSGGVSLGGTTDLFPTTQNITAQDIATATVAGFQGQSFIIGTPTAGSAATFALSGMTTVNIQITGIWTGSLRIEASFDNGTLYVSKFSRLPGTVYAGAATVTLNASLIAAVSGCTQIRVRSIAAWTGTAIVTISETINDHLVDVLNPIRLLDSTTNTLMTIKPASTAPLTTDTAMVVALSPNTNLASGQPIINGEQTDFTGTFTNATQTGTVVATNLDGYGNVLISINGTYATATGVFEGSDDGGTTWYTVQASRDNTNVIETGYATLTNTSQTWQINNPGFDSIRVRSTAVASGTVNVRMSASAAPGAAGANIAIGTALPTGSNIIGAITGPSAAPLALDATLTGGTQQAKITDGTNIANVVSGDTGFNGIAVASGSKQFSFTTSAAGAQNIGQWNIEGYSYIEVNYSSVGSGLALTGQYAPTSGGTYVSSSSFATSPTVNAVSALGVLVNNTYRGPILGNYFQIAVSALTSGTFAGTVTLRAIPPPLNVISVPGTTNMSGTKTNNNAAPAAAAILPVIGSLANAAQPSWTEGFQVVASTDLKGNARTRISDAAGNDRGANVNANNALNVGGETATGSAVPANAFYGAMRNTSGNLQGFTTGGFGDGGSNEEKLAITPYINNGSSLDRMRTAGGATNTTGTGLLGVGNMVYDGTNFQLMSAASRIGDASSANGSVSSALSGYNGATYDRIRTANGASATTGTGLLGAGQMVWDGTNWQKQRSDTNGVPTVNGSGVAGTAYVPYSVRITSSTTTTPTAATCYVSSITIVTTTGVAATTLTIQDKSGTPLILVDGLTTTSTLVGLPQVLNFQSPIKMTGGIDIITAGVSPASNNVWISYFQ